MLFSRRHFAAESAVAWCRENAVPISPLNIVTALDQAGLLREAPEKGDIVCFIRNDALTPFAMSRLTPEDDNVVIRHGGIRPKG